MNSSTVRRSRMYDIFSNNFKIEKGTKIGKETKKDKKLYALKPKPKKSEPQNRGISKGGHPYVRDRKSVV